CLRFAYATTCCFACPPVGADQTCVQPTRTFTSGLPTVWSPAPSPDITTVPTGQFALAGLSPVRPSTSFTALSRRTPSGRRSGSYHVIGSNRNGECGHFRGKSVTGRRDQEP